MCGIFGIITIDPELSKSDKLKQAVDDLFKLSESRGKEASGLSILRDKEIVIYKQPIPASQLIKQSKYHNLFKSSEGNLSPPFALIGHSRLTTNGTQEINTNNQPVSNGRGVAVHNGIVINDRKLWEKVLKKPPRYEVDTEVIVELITDFYDQGFSLENATAKAFRYIKGAATIAMMMTKSPHLILATNTGSLYMTQTNDSLTVVCASERYILRTFIDQIADKSKLEFQNVVHVQSDRGYVVNWESLALQEFSLIKTNNKSNSNVRRKSAVYKIQEAIDKDPRTTKTLIIHLPINNLAKIERHQIEEKAIARIRRCSKCILPETMPLISFDNEGVCNYCRQYQKIQVKEKQALEELVKPYRNNTGEADCIVAFSGGRDSSYGLHYLKTELKLNPIAYTYDWGMVTDLARRNQSRITSKLGIEHIIVSADIKKKRENIRKNVEAWLKKPDLGMVPLFMAGDKQAEYYAEELKRKIGIKLVFYCRGNELENEEFKWGHCGIKGGSPQGVLHNLSWVGKMQLASYYGLQYLRNPSYVNSSIIDTLFAYFVAYIMPLDFIYLWHYIPWNEETIISTLKKEYNWETEPDTQVTWRIDDGSVAFYNYIFYQVQGFTENDTFRSNQIREGVITRKKAVQLIQVENQPRYKALKWYFDQIRLNGDEALTVIDHIPKLYKPIQL